MHQEWRARADDGDWADARAKDFGGAPRAPRPGEPLKAVARASARSALIPLGPPFLVRDRAQAVLRVFAPPREMKLPLSRCRCGRHFAHTRALITADDATSRAALPASSALMQVLHRFPLTSLPHPCRRAPTQSLASHAQRAPPRRRSS